MDNTLQKNSGGLFNIKAYGLAIKLLHANIPLHWAIRAGKGKDEYDFNATVKMTRPTASTTSQLLFFKAGPFIIDSSLYAKAIPVIDAFNSAQNDPVAVYELVGQQKINVKHTLVHKPFVAVLNSGSNYFIQTGYLDACGLTESVHYKV